MQVELFKNQTPPIQAIDKVWKLEFEKMEQDLKNFFNDILTTQYYATIVFDSNLFEFSNIFDKEFFNNISLLLASYKGIGSYEAIINICKAILGSDTAVTFANNGKDIKIIATATGLGNMITTNLDNIVDTTNGNIQWVNNRLSQQKDQLTKILRLFLPAGIKYNITFEA